MRFIDILFLPCLALSAFSCITKREFIIGVWYYYYGPVATEIWCASEAVNPGICPREISNGEMRFE